MTVLFFTRRFYPQVGGVEKHIMEIATRLIMKGHSVGVISERTENLSAGEQINGIQVYRINAGKEDRLKKIRIWKELFRLRDIIKKADVIHCHDVVFWYIPFKLLFPRKSMFTTFHGFESYPIAGKAIKVRKLSERLSLGSICVGKYLTKWYGTKPATIIYGAIHPHPPILSVEGNKLQIGFVGRLDADTGILIYLKALQILKEKKIPFDFIVYGDGKLKEQVEQYGKVYGFVARPETIMKKVDIIFTASYLSSMEAFQNKKIVISVFDNPLKKDILHMTPWAKWITITDSPEVVVKTLLDIRRSAKKYTVNSEDAFQWVNTQTWDALVHTYLKLWKIK